MSAVRQAAAGAAARATRGGSPARRRLPASLLLLPAGIALWAAGTAQTDPAALGPYGLLNAVPVIWYAGLALVILSAGIELARRPASGWRLGLHAAGLTVLLYGTAPLVYAQGRYSWLYKTVGVVQYINYHGRLDRHIDIYQNWPGFFAFAAWLGRTAGIASPLSYAKWAQLAVELAALPLLRLIYIELGLTHRQRWLALLLYPAANWIAQDYFSPQAFGTLLSLTIFAVALRWLGRDPGRRAAPGAQRAAFILLVAGLFWVLTTAHELSPYIVVVQLAALAVTGWLRPRWVPALLAAIAVGYLIPRIPFVSSHYGLLTSIGSFFSNVAPPSFAAGHIPASELLIQKAAKLLSLGVWALAVAGALRAAGGPRGLLPRAAARSRLPVLALLAMTFCPVLVLAGQAYGNEGILRVYLFSLPWAAALGAAALIPAGDRAPRASRASRAARARWVQQARRIAQLRWEVVLAPAALAIATMLFLLAFFGDDATNVMSTAEVNTVTGFLRAARPGPIYTAAANAPLSDTARYPQFPLLITFGAGGVAALHPRRPGLPAVIARASLAYTHGTRPAYVVITPSMVAYSRAQGILPPASLTQLTAELSRARDWRLVVKHRGILIFELPPAHHPSRR